MLNIASEPALLQEAVDAAMLLGQQSLIYKNQLCRSMLLAACRWLAER